MLGKTPMWGNPMREREILLFCFKKVQNNINNTFQPKEIPLTAQKLPTTNLS
jgi:hypothetical protein